MKIYSKIQPDKLLHIVHRLTDVINRKTQRVDLINPDQFIQCSSLKMSKGTTFKAHKHIWKSGPTDVIAQESWVVFVGDVSFTLSGGHNYEILEDSTIVYEYKTGPYEGQILDKEFLDD